MEGELGSPTGKPCNFGTIPSLVVAYVLGMSVWYPVEQGSDAEEEPRSSAALETSLCRVYIISRVEYRAYFSTYLGIVEYLTRVVDTRTTRYHAP